MPVDGGYHALSVFIRINKKMNSSTTLSVREQNSNIIRLATAQALAGANSVVFYATGALVGNTTAPDPSLATFPVTMFVIGMAACILPFGALAKKYGRRRAFMAGTGAGILTGLIAAVAVITGSFLLFCIAAFMGGAYASVALSFRFAVTDGLPTARRARALSLVMAGGVMAGVTGPMLVTVTMDFWPPHTFAVTFIVQAIIAAVSAFILKDVHETASHTATEQKARPLREIIRQPGFKKTVFSGAAAYMVMNFLMTAAPLSMHKHGISLHASNLGIQWHVIAMYAPGFITGSLITRYGTSRVISAGLLITVCSVFIGLSGNQIFHYWLSLILLGIGWNFGFTGASAKIIDYHKPHEKSQVQSLNDFIIFGVMIIGSFTSGALLNMMGWSTVLWCSLIPITFALMMNLSGNKN